MHVDIRRSLCSAAFAGGLLALGAGAASAAKQLDASAQGLVSGVHGVVSQPAQSTSSNGHGLLGGLLSDVLGTVQVAVPITAPVNVSGNAVGVLASAVSTGSQVANVVAAATPATRSSLIEPSTPILPVTPGDPGTPVAPVTPVTQTSPLPQNPVVVTDGVMASAHALSAGTVPLAAPAPAQLACPGAGVWPVYTGAAILFLIGLSLVLVRKFDLK